MLEAGATERRRYLVSVTPHIAVRFTTIARDFSYRSESVAHFEVVNSGPGPAYDNRIYRRFDIPTQISGCRRKRLL